MFNYTLGIPATNDNPSADQPLMKINNDNIPPLIAVDHVGFNLNQGGYHTVIHEITQTIDPAAIAGINQIYSKNYTPDTAGGTADTQLFNRTGVGGISQLTGNSAQADGWNWVGGVLLQWGTVTSGAFAGGSATGTVTFKNRVGGAIPFPTNCFVVIPNPFWTTASISPNGSGTVNINQTTLSKTSFTWKFNSNSGNYRGFYWFAVGN